MGLIFRTISVTSLCSFRRAVFARALFVLLALAGTTPATASPQGLPGERDYYSTNGRLVFSVTPNSVLTDACTGELYALHSGRLKLLWRHPLANRIAPENVLVANDGTIVTLDNWESIGTGDTVVVVYAPDGKKRFHFRLEQILSRQELDAVQTTTSSRWWRNAAQGEHIDESGRRVIIATMAGQRAISLGTGGVQSPGEGAGGLDSHPKPFIDRREDILDNNRKYAVVGRLECLTECGSRDNWFIHLRPGNKYPQRLRLTVPDIAAAKNVREKNVRAIVRVEKGGDVSAVRAYAESITLQKPATMKELYETPLQPLERLDSALPGRDHADH